MQIVYAIPTSTLKNNISAKIIPARPGSPINTFINQIFPEGHVHAWNIILFITAHLVLA